MNRGALIIASPGRTGADNYLPGVDVDLKNYQKFLCSSAGGAWLPNEIKVLRSPTKVDVDSAIAQLSRKDYSFVVFSGHGYHSADRRATIVELSPSVEYNSDELRKGAKRHTLILDCCRKVIADTRMRKALASMDSLMEFAEHSAASRLKFESEIGRCPEGLAVLYACSKDQVAGDSSDRGGFFSAAFLDAAADWSKARLSGGSYSIVEAHAKAEADVLLASGGRQHPAIDKPRSSPYFPISVKA